MPQTGCYRETFQPNTPVFASKSYMPIQSKIAGHFTPDMGRPFIPYCGAILDPVSLTMLMPDTILNNQTFIAAFIDTFKEARQASINFYNDLVGSTIDPASPFASYLAKKTIVDNAMEVRFYQVCEIVSNFWTNANAGWTPDQYTSALAGLEAQIIAEADHSLYIPNARYDWDAASALSILATAWKLANGNWKGLLTIEFAQ
jgi:hypothetical protein